MGSEYVFLRQCIVCEGDMGWSSAFGGRGVLGQHPEWGLYRRVG